MVADQLAFFIMSEFYEDDEGLRRVAEHFRARPSNDRLRVESEHLPNAKRARDYLCWLEGKIDSLAGGQGACAAAYQDLLAEWDDRLAPSWKERFEFELESE